MNATKEAWELVVTALARELAVMPAASIADVTSHLVETCGYEIADTLEPNAKRQNARVALTYAILDRFKYNDPNIEK